MAGCRTVRYLDCIAINHYHRWNTKVVEIENIVEWTGKPVLVSEFYAMQYSGMSDVGGGAGFRVRNKLGRGRFYQNFVTQMLQGKNTVGFQWFKYQDDANCNKEIVPDPARLVESPTPFSSNNTF